MARPSEEFDPGVNVRYYCFDCYREEFKHEATAHFEYETADELWQILEAADGRLVTGARPMTTGGRLWVRVVDGEVVCLNCAPTALAGDETWGDLRVLDSDERWVEARDADA